MELAEAYKIITTPSRSRPAEVKRLQKFLMTLSETSDEQKYQDFFKQIPSNWTTLSVDKQFALNNPGMFHIGDKDSQFLLINLGVTGDGTKNIFLLGFVFGKKVVATSPTNGFLDKTLSEVLDTTMLVDDLLLVLDFPNYKILNWVVTPIESLVGVE